MKSSKKLQTINEKTVDKIIAWAWDDRKTFDEIKEEFNLTEREVIDLMRMKLKPSSWRMWRKRVNGRVTKHRKLFKEKRRGSKLFKGKDLNSFLEQEQLKINVF